MRAQLLPPDAKLAALRGRIVILAGDHLCHHPRVLKEATALGRAHYDVIVLGGWFDRELKARDQELLQSPFTFVPVIDMTESGTRRLALRIRNKLGLLAHRRLGIENPWQLGYAYDALRQAALHTEADLYIAHLEQAMAAAMHLLKRGKPVGVDMEDWFSEDLLPEARQRRPIRLLRAAERALLSGAVHRTTTSHALSEALARAFDCPAPAVVYNAFPWAQRANIDGLAKDRRDRRRPSIHWFSQTLGPGRGIEDLLACLPHLAHDAEIHLRGAVVAGFDKWIAEHTPANWRDRLFIHGLVGNDELLSRIAEHDIGFAGEMNYCRNRELSVTNKILYYLLGGLATVASDIAAHREVAAQATDAVFSYPSGDAAALAQRLDALMASPEALQRAKAAALRAAEETFCWERQETVLLDSVARALERAHRR